LRRRAAIDREANAMRVTKRALQALLGVAVIAPISFVVLRPRPTQLLMTPRAGDDTVVINQTGLTRLRASVLDQYRRHLAADTDVRYAWQSGDSIPVAPDGTLRCVTNGTAAVRATLAHLSRDFVLRCRPVASIEAATWLDLFVGDSARDFSFAAHDPDGRIVTELRGTVTVGDASVAAIEGTTVRAKRPGATVAVIDVGGQETRIPIMVYQPVESFVDNPPKLGLMAMSVALARGDTIRTPLPRASFWVTYVPKDRGAAPPTIELLGNGGCSAGDGVHQRRVEDGEYAKYCFSGSGSRMMIAHGAEGAEVVRGTVAIRLMW
jgi:hypothetical protein